MFLVLESGRVLVTLRCLYSSNLFYSSFRLYICELLFFTSSFLSSSVSPPPPCCDLTGADYWPDHNTDRCPAACDPSLPLLIPGLASRSTFAFLGEKKNIDKQSVRDWISTRPLCELTVLKRRCLTPESEDEAALLVTWQWSEDVHCFSVVRPGDEIMLVVCKSSQNLSKLQLCLVM